MRQTATVRKTLDPALTGREAERLERDLHKRIIGQDEAIQQIINVYQTYLAGMNGPGRPVGSGPSAGSMSARSISSARDSAKARSMTF